MKLSPYNAFATTLRLMLAWGFRVGMLDHFYGAQTLCLSILALQLFATLSVPQSLMW